MKIGRINDARIEMTGFKATSTEVTIDFQYYGSPVEVQFMRTRLEALAVNPDERVLPVYSGLGDTDADGIYIFSAIDTNVVLWKPQKSFLKGSFKGFKVSNQTAITMESRLLGFERYVLFGQTSDVLYSHAENQLSYTHYIPFSDKWTYNAIPANRTQQILIDTDVRYGMDDRVRMFRAQSDPMFYAGFSKWLGGTAGGVGGTAPAGRLTNAFVQWSVEMDDWYNGAARVMLPGGDVVPGRLEIDTDEFTITNGIVTLYIHGRFLELSGAAGVTGGLIKGPYTFEFHSNYFDNPSRTNPVIIRNGPEFVVVRMPGTHNSIDISLGRGHRMFNIAVNNLRPSSTNAFTMYGPEHAANSGSGTRYIRSNTTSHYWVWTYLNAVSRTLPTADGTGKIQLDLSLNGGTVANMGLGIANGGQEDWATVNECLDQWNHVLYEQTRPVLPQ